MQYTVLIPGGFKPPHKGHYDYIKFYLDNPDVKEVHLYIGEKSRDTITLEQTEAILDLYGLLDHPKMNYKRATIRQGKKGDYTNPLSDCYDYAEVRVLEPVALGCSTKDIGYRKGFMKYFDGIRNDIIDAPMFEQQDDLSATDFRTALQNGDSIAEFLPDGIDEQSVLALFNA
jgi:hypothetical protein